MCLGADLLAGHEVRSLGLESKLPFCSPVATAEFSRFAGVLSAAL